MTERTIEQESYFGNMKRLTRDEYVNHWVDHMAEIKKLSIISADRKIIADFLDYTADLAGRNFDEIYERQQS